MSLSFIHRRHIVKPKATANASTHTQRPGGTDLCTELEAVLENEGSRSSTWLGSTPRVGLDTSLLPSRYPVDCALRAVELLDRAPTRTSLFQQTEELRRRRIPPCGIILSQERNLATAVRLSYMLSETELGGKMLEQTADRVESESSSPPTRRGAMEAFWMACRLPRVL